MGMMRGLFRAGAAVAIGYVAARFISEWLKEQSEPASETAAAYKSSPMSTAVAPDDVAADIATDTDHEDEIIVVETPSLPAKPAQAADFTQIKGIGPTFARRLQEAGIVTFAQLAALSPERATEITGVKPWQASDPAEWIAQAQELAG